VPSLWYLNEINFLRDWEVKTEGRYTVDSEDKNSSEKSVSTTDTIFYS
jgi:hypothetical protein